jgi:hypothetical protein
MYQYVCRYSDVIQFLLKRIKSTIFVTDMKMGMNKVLVCNRNGYGIELFCFFSISNSIHNRIEIFDSIVNSNHLDPPHRAVRSKISSKNWKSKI